MGMTKEYRQKLISKHICVYCKKHNDRYEIGSICSNCLGEEKKFRNMLQKEFKICPMCRKNKLYGEEKTCIECKTTRAINIKKSRDKNRDKYNEYMRDYHKKIYEYRKTNNLCTICGGKRDTEKLKCNKCRTKEKENRQRKRKNNMTMSEKIKFGICIRCNEPAIEGQKLCQRHYDIQVKSLEDSKEKRMESKNAYHKYNLPIEWKVRNSERMCNRVD